MATIKILERYYNRNSWYDVTDMADVYCTGKAYEYKVLVGEVEVCQINGVSEEMSISQLLQTHTVSGPILACLK